MSSKLEYSRRLYDDVLDWYKSADSKAQVVLAIDTAFLAFLTSAIFSEPDKLRAILAVFSWITWLNLALSPKLCYLGKIMRKSLPDKGLRWFLADKNEFLAEIVVQQGFQNK